MKFNGWMMLLSVMFLACDNRESQTKEGLALAKKKCSSCHEFVEAGKLERTTWLRDVLPEMRKRAKLNKKEQAAITEYYSLMSPEHLEKSSQEIPRDNWLFEPLQPKQKLPGTSSTTFVAVDTLSHTIYSSDAATGKLYRWNDRLEAVDTIDLSYGIGNAIFSDSEVVFTLIGDVKQLESYNGSVVKYDVNKKLTLKGTIASNLPRSVYSAAADLNNDGLTDYITCGFGHEKGALFINWQNPGNTYKKEELVSTAGSVQVHVEDFNKDGWKDFMVLFSNAEESIRLFLNKGNGSFTMKTLISFLPVAGSTSFQVTDINNDGNPDIIYTSGDSADISKIFKPYHGLYIYLNSGNFNYSQEFFFPINGCTKAIASDLDNDGDLDIATIAFFADLNNIPAEKCIIFEQDKPMHFKPHSPAIDLLGRWICMEVADYDDDGDKDIIIGNFSRGLQNVPVITNKWDRLTPFVVLKNTRR